MHRRHVCSAHHVLDQVTPNIGKPNDYSRSDNRAINTMSTRDNASASIGNGDVDGATRDTLGDDSSSYDGASG
jgi:hypothetical protein